MYSDKSPVYNYTNITMFLGNGLSWQDVHNGKLKSVGTPLGQEPNVPDGYLSIDISGVNTSTRVVYTAQTYAYFVFDKIVLYY
jgi:hypothetical protein